MRDDYILMQSSRYDPDPVLLEQDSQQVFHPAEKSERSKDSENPSEVNISS